MGRTYEATIKIVRIACKHREQHVTFSLTNAKHSIELFFTLNLNKKDDLIRLSRLYNYTNSPCINYFNGIVRIYTIKHASELKAVGHISTDNFFTLTGKFQELKLKDLKKKKN